jgi:small conductance mechanosensitive channel
VIIGFEQNGIPLGVSGDMLVMQKKDPTAPPKPPSIGA